MPVSHTWRSFPCHPPCQLRAQRLGDGENWYEPGSNVREAIALKSMGCQSSPVDPDCRRPAPTPKHRLRTWGSEVRILPGAPKQPATGRFFCARRIAGPPRTAGVRARAKRCFASGSRSPFRARQNNRPLAGFFVPGGFPGPPRAASVRACAKRCFASGRCASRRAESIDRCRHGGSAATRASARRVGQSSRAYQAGRSHGRGSCAKRQSPRERCNRRFPRGPTGCTPAHRTGRPCGRDGQAAPGNGPASWSAHGAEGSSP